MFLEKFLCKIWRKWGLVGSWTSSNLRCLAETQQLSLRPQLFVGRLMAEPQNWDVKVSWLLLSKTSKNFIKKWFEKSKIQEYFLRWTVETNHFKNVWKRANRRNRFTHLVVQWCFRRYKLKRLLWATGEFRDFQAVIVEGSLRIQISKCQKC